MIINIKSEQIRFIFPNEEIPDGWRKRKQNIIYKCIDCGKQISKKGALRC